MDHPGNVPLEPKVADGVKVFELTIEEIQHRIDAIKELMRQTGMSLGEAKDALDGPASSRGTITRVRFGA